MRQIRKYELSALFLTSKKLKYYKIATNQSLNLSPIVSTLGLFYWLHWLQIPFATTSISSIENPIGNLI